MLATVAAAPASWHELPIDGRLPAERVRELLHEAGMTVAPNAAETPFLWLNPRYLLVQASTLRDLVVAHPGGAVLRAPDGDAIAIVHDGRAIADLPSIALPDPDDGVRIDDTWSWNLVEQRLRLRRIADLVRSGVRVVDPARVYVEPSVSIAPGAVLWPDVVLRGTTRILEHAEIQSGCWLEDTEVGAHAVIKAHSVCESATIAERCAVGPMAHLRPGAKLDAEVKVGNFVEVKNTHLHTGAKASHLTYLGDAEVGADANVGAGTITCNYDGFGKHRTEIGAGAFIGSNTALVAPVSVGAGAIVGAGSVITRDVPADALAVERSEQRTLEGRAPSVHARNRERAAARKKSG